MTSTAWRGRTLTQYLNSMFDFAAYNLHGEMLKLEAAGKPAFLRDDRGEVVILCNDGNFCQSSVRSPDSFIGGSHLIVLSAVLTWLASHVISLDTCS